jgi:ABC-2 type transport system permease protein
MLESAKKHFKLYRKFFLMYLKTQLVYFKDTLLGLVNQFFSLISSLLLIGLIFTQVNSIYGWSFWELVFLAGIGRFIVNFHTVFMFSTVFLGEHYIRTGRLDRYLVRPLNVLYQLYASRVNFHNLGDSVASVIIVVYAATRIQGFSVTPLDLVYTFLSLGSAVMVIAAIFLVFGTVGFWTARTGSLFSLFWRIRKFRKYPFGIYSEAMRIFFITLMPIAFASFFQASFLLGKFRWFELQMASIVAGPIFYLLAYRFWLFGLSRYSSTGS